MVIFYFLHPFYFISWNSIFLLFTMSLVFSIFGHWKFWKVNFSVLLTWQHQYFFFFDISPSCVFCCFHFKHYFTSWHHKIFRIILYFLCPALVSSISPKILVPFIGKWYLKSKTGARKRNERGLGRQKQHSGVHYVHVKQGANIVVSQGCWRFRKSVTCGSAIWLQNSGKYSLFLLTYSFRCCRS